MLQENIAIPATRGKRGRREILCRNAVPVSPSEDPWLSNFCDQRLRKSPSPNLMQPILYVTGLRSRGGVLGPFSARVCPGPSARTDTQSA